MAKVPPEDRAAGSTAAAAITPASATEVETPPCRPDEEHASKVSFHIISPSSTLYTSAPTTNSQRFAHLESIIPTNIGWRSLAGA